MNPMIRISLLSIAIVSPVLSCARMKPTDDGTDVPPCQTCKPLDKEAFVGTGWTQHAEKDIVTKPCMVWKPTCSTNGVQINGGEIVIDKAVTLTCEAGQWKVAGVTEPITKLKCGATFKGCQTCYSTDFAPTDKSVWTAPIVFDSKTGCMSVTGAKCTNSGNAKQFTFKDGAAGSFNSLDATCLEAYGKWGPVRTDPPSTPPTDGYFRTAICMA